MRRSLNKTPEWVWPILTGILCFIMGIAVGSSRFRNPALAKPWSNPNGDSPTAKVANGTSVVSYVAIAARMQIAAHASKVIASQTIRSYDGGYTTYFALTNESNYKLLQEQTNSTASDIRNITIADQSFTRVRDELENMNVCLQTIVSLFIIEDEKDDHKSLNIPDMPRFASELRKFEESYARFNLMIPGS